MINPKLFSSLSHTLLTENPLKRVTAHRNRKVLLTSTGAVSVFDEGKEGGRNGSYVSG